MRLTCPLCGDRDRREFYYYGASDYLHRPGPEAGDADWENYLTLRDNPAGVTKDLWYHDLGCSSWLEVTRNTVTHEVLGARMIAPPGDGKNARKATQPADPKPKTARAPRKPKGAGA